MAKEANPHSYYSALSMISQPILASEGNIFFEIKFRIALCNNISQFLHLYE